MTHSRPEQARTYLQDALTVNRKCVRAYILLGDIALNEGAVLKRRAKLWKRIEVAESGLSAAGGRALPGRLSAARSARRGHWSAARLPGAATLRSICSIPCFRPSWSDDGPGQAPTSWCATSCGARRRCWGWTSCSKPSCSRRPLERRRDLELIRNLVHQHTRSLALYRCDKCGFKARQFYWHCPACHGWETYPPRRNEERELAA